MGNQTICSERIALVGWLLLYNWVRIRDFSTSRIGEPLLLARKKMCIEQGPDYKKHLAILKIP